MTHSKNYRHELKYRCSRAQLEMLRCRLSGLISSDSHAVGGQYCVRSMYFDSYNHRCYFENESGTDPREKYRIRIYNANSSRITLECKRKQSGKTLKTSCPLSLEDFYNIMEGCSLQHLQDKPPVLRKFLLLQKTELFRPAVIVEYDRYPYVHRDGNVRITMDTNIRSSDAFDRFFDSNIPTRQILPEGQHLLEVKYDSFLPDFIKESLQIEELQRTAFSKYYLCRRYMKGI